ncbi:holin family protein [Pseudogracilibacillus auburnensis]|uniref:Toxin secretion/phage lysis holin n=1 Tax=Pseudogracilibacillus auburnensis TaxID=1494959 RepID=A0A2V3VL35_9BACI|nr:phage holin family protein [Pseudogracilibacillus auburnensis]PXW82507.1 toxin secretion/phage lysis holin [Pseudogracilibacillus auburnensis]
METLFKSIVAVLGAIVTFLLGGWSPLLQVLVLFIAFDYILGVLVAASYGQLNSKIGFRGIAKKVMILALVAVAYSIDTIMGDGTFIRDAVIFFYLANELLSILETVGKTNLPVPDVLRKAVETLNSKSKSSD